MADDLPEELVVVEAGRQEVGASLQELAVKEVGCCLGVEEEARRSPLVGQGKSLLAVGGEARASLVEH